MEELKAILITLAKRYPLMQPTDAVKLIYQNEFGGGHLIRDEQAFLTTCAGNTLTWRKIRQHSCMRKSETASSVSIWQRLSPKIWRRQKSPFRCPFRIPQGLPSVRRRSGHLQPDQRQFRVLMGQIASCSLVHLLQGSVCFALDHPSLF